MYLKRRADACLCTRIVGTGNLISGMACRSSAPMLSSTDVTAEPQRGAVPRKAGSSNGSTGSTILVVDDEPDVRLLIRKILEPRGYEVREAVTGRDALKALFEQRPDAVVLDVTMPGLDGWGTLERIRESRDVPC